MTFNALRIDKKRNALVHCAAMGKSVPMKNVLLAITRGGQSSRLEWSGVLRYAAKKPGWKLLSSSTFPHNFFEFIAQTLESDSVDGLIANDSTAGKISARLRQNPGLKGVFLDSKPDGTDFPATIADDAEVAELEIAAVIHENIIILYPRFGCGCTQLEMRQGADHHKGLLLWKHGMDIYALQPFPGIYILFHYAQKSKKLNHCAGYCLTLRSNSAT